MQRVDRLEDVARNDGSVLTVGTFDGVHRGHQAILHYLMERAEKSRGASTVVSFNPHPSEVVRDEQVPLLTTNDERAEVLASLGIDRFIVIPFTREFSQLSATEFAEDILFGRIGLQEIIIGYDHGFGKGRKGDNVVLEELGDKLGFSVEVIPAQRMAEGAVFSSSRIRTLLREEGDVETAAELLGRYYSVSGAVDRGAGRGRKIGYPTANISPSNDRKLIPFNGVYAVRVNVLNGNENVGGMMNIGRRPTFEDEGRHLEVHLFDLDTNLYGKELRVEFVGRVRNERRFESVEALQEQLSRDEARCRDLLK